MQDIENNAIYGAKSISLLLYLEMGQKVANFFRRQSEVKSRMPPTNLAFQAFCD